MTSQILVKSKYLGKFERHAEEIIPLLLDGVPQREVAARFDGTLRGLQQFMERHEVDLKQVKADAVEAVNQCASQLGAATTLIVKRDAEGVLVIEVGRPELKSARR